MIILAVNTSGVTASLALLNGQEWSTHALDQRQKAAQFLIPAIESLIKAEKITLDEIDLFAVTSGPGSFTGLRIGITTVKSFAYATKSSLVGVNSLAAIAQNAWSNNCWTDGKLTVAMNAFRKQLFVATFDIEEFDAQSTQGDSFTQVISEADLVDLMERSDSKLIVSGIAPEAACLEGISSEKMILEDFNSSAKGVGEIGIKMVKNKNVADPISLLPNYFRGSAAEEKLRNRS